MHNEVTKWCNCSLTLHSESTQRWKFEDTNNPKKISKLQCANISLQVPLRTPRFDTPACHPHHALRPTCDCTTGANVVVTNAMGAVRSPTPVQPGTVRRDNKNMGNSWTHEHAHSSDVGFEERPCRWVQDPCTHRCSTQGTWQRSRACCAKVQSHFRLKRDTDFFDRSEHSPRNSVIGSQSKRIQKITDATSSAEHAVRQATVTPTFLLFSEAISDYTFTAGALK